MIKKSILKFLIWIVGISSFGASVAEAQSFNYNINGAEFKSQIIYNFFIYKSCPNGGSSYVYALKDKKGQQSSKVELDIDALKNTSKIKCFESKVLASAGTYTLHEKHYLNSNNNDSSEQDLDKFTIPEYTQILTLKTGAVELLNNNSEVKISWNPLGANSMVYGHKYFVYRNDTLVGLVSGSDSSFNDKVTPNSRNRYKVKCGFKFNSPFDGYNYGNSDSLYFIDYIEKNVICTNTPEYNIFQAVNLNNSVDSFIITWLQLTEKGNASGISYRIRKNGVLYKQYTNADPNFILEKLSGLDSSNTYVFEIYSGQQIIYTKTQTVSASFYNQKQSDSYIDLVWNIPTAILRKANDTSIYVSLYDSTFSKEIYSFQIDTFNSAAYGVNGSFKHFVGPNSYHTYSLNMFVIGNGSLLSSTIPSLTANTLTYQRPKLAVSSNSYPGKVVLSWKNKSDFASQFFLYRDNLLIANIDTIATTFADSFAYSGANNIVNGKSYSYILRGYNSGTSSYLAADTIVAATAPVSFMASRNLYANKVNLTWNNMGAFAGKLRVRRDGNILSDLTAADVSYTDEKPIYGKKHIYELELWKDDGVIMIVKDTGMVLPIGSVSGYIVSADTFRIGYDNVSIIAKTTYLRDTFIYNTTTDSGGAFTIPNIYFGTKATLTITAKKAGLNFADSIFNYELSNAVPKISNVLFTYNFKDSLEKKMNNPAVVKNNLHLNDPSNFVLLTTDSNGNILNGNRLRLHWKWEKNINSAFVWQVFRNNILLSTKLEAIGTRTDGYLDYIDTAGIPGQNYQYKVAFYAVGKTTAKGTKKLISYNYFFSTIKAYPLLAGVTNIDLKSIDQQDSGGYVQLKWDYTGANTGFIIYRGGDSIATVFQNKTNRYIFKDYNILFSTNYTYEVKAYRTIGKANFVCTTAGTFVAGTNAIGTPTLPVPYNCSSPVSTDNSHTVIVTLNTALGVDYNFDGFYINRYNYSLNAFEKTFFIRKEMTTSTGSKSYQFIDETALPNVIYAYTYQTAKLAPASSTNLYASYTQTNMPDLPPPSGLTIANNGVANNGYIKVEWNRVVGAKVKHQTYLITASNSATNVIDSIEVVANNIRNYNYILKDNYKGEAINFTIQSCWKYMGKVFYSVTNAYNGTQTKGYASKQANNYTAPSNFKASKDRSTHIFLQWDYPSYIVPAAFELYVNGKFEKSIPSDVRTYNYFTTDDGTDFVFQLKAIAPKTTGKGSSAWVAASGKVISQRKIKGTVTNLYNSKGIAGIRVDCYYDYCIKGLKWDPYWGSYAMVCIESGPINSASAYTDSSGYYEMIVPSTNTVNFKASTISNQGLPKLSYYVAAAGANIKLSANNLSITDFETTKDNRTINFTDTTYLPSAIDNNIAEPSNATAVVNSTDKTVEIRWNVSSNNFSGFKIYRDLSQIGTIAKGEARQFIDSFGSSNIQYNYSIKAFWNIDDEVKLSKPAVTSAKFPGLVPVTNFTATPLPSTNQVLLSWSHLYDNHSYYEVRRGALVLGKINTGTTFTLYDSTGSPNEIYNYSIVCYQKMGTRLIKSTRESAQATFPSIQIVQNLQAGYSVLKEAVKLTWEYKPTNIAGFKIYRGNKYLGFTDKAKSFDFEDISFIPDTTLAYFVTVVAQRDTNTFESRPWKVKAQTPSLIAPVNLQAVQNSDLENFVKLTWQIPSIRGTNGYRVFRDNQLLITILDSSRLAYADTSGIFGTNYAYKVDAFATRNERSFYSQAVSANFDYPKLSPPQLTYASDSNFDYIDLNFKYDASSNYGFIVYRDGVEIDTIKVAGRRKYTDMLKTAKANGTGFSYKLRAYKIINNNYYYSDFSNALVGYAGKLMLHYKIDATSGGNYGYKVTMAGNYAMVYAKGRGANNSGEVDVYRKKKYTWELVQTIKSRFGNTAYFGEYIGMNDSFVLISYHEYGSATGTYQMYYKLNPSGVFEFLRYTDMKNENYAYAINNKRIISGYGSGNTIYVIDIGANNNFSSVYQVNADQTCTNSCGSWGSTVTMDDSSVYTVSRGDYRFYRAYNFQTKKYYAVGGLFTDFGGNKYEGVWDAFFYKNNNRGSDNAVNSKTLTRLFYYYSWYKPGFLMQMSLTGKPYYRFDYHDITDYAKARVFCGDTILLLVKDDSAIFVHANDPARAWALRYKLNGTLTDAAFSGNSAIIGSPTGNSGAGSVYFFNFNNSANDPLSVTASKGTIAGKVKIAWTVPNKKINDYYNIYRDGELIDNTAANQFVYYDATGIPGKEYHYAVRIVDTAGNMSNDISDVGYSAGDGSIQGYVLSGVSSSGIPNVQVKAYATIDGETFAYYTNTNASGKYNFKNVYYNKAATFYIVPLLAGHKLNRDTTSVDVDLQATLGAAATFYDLTSYVVKGVIARNTVNCGLDSVNVVFNTIFKNGTTSKIATTTNEQGAYSFVYDPADQTIDYYSIAVDTFRVVTHNNIQDTDFFKFDHVFYNKINLTASSTATYNFYDTAAFPLIIDVKTACGAIPGVNKFILYIASEDGCYEKSITTNNSGHALVFLPALKYSITVKDVETPSANNIQVVNYLSQRNNEIDFSTFGGSDSLRDYAYKNPFVTEFVYHRPPEINMYGFKRFFCNPPPGTEIPIIKQGATIGLNPFVKEVHYASSCGVSGGYVHIINDAAELGDTSIYFDPVTNSFPKYYFTANGPNVVSPHLKNIVVQYYTADDVFMGDKQYLVIVEGIASTPGSDFIVDVDTSSSGLVQMPLFVLRDPPGDASFSYIEKNTSFKNSLEVSSSDEFAAGVRLESEFDLFGIGVRAEFASKGGGSDGEHVGYEVSVENKQRISTSPVSNIFSADGSSFMVGDRADVIVGGGVVNAYGIANEIIVDDSCRILNKKKIATAYNGLKTTWVYTVDQIMHLIDNYALDIEAISAGQLSSVGVSADKFLAVTKLRKKNWENVLEYHRTKSVPYYNLCNTANYDNIPEPYKTQIKAWSKEGFCDLIGSYVTDASGNVSFVLKPNITWTQALIEKYNKVSEVVRNLSDYKYQLKNATGVSWSQTRLDNMNLDKAYNGLFGFDAENISFSGGGTSFSKEQTVSKSRSSGYDQSSYMDVEAFGGVTFGTEITTYFGIWAGVGAGAAGGTIKSIANATGNVGVTFNFHHQQDQSSTTSFDTSITTGFELNDETTGDQYSVLAFKGIEKNHTPYFVTLGGRSACPPEPGTIYRDDVRIAFERPDGSKVTFPMKGLDPSKQVVVPIKLTNMNPFNEEREFMLEIRPETNQNGAIIREGGKTIGQAVIRVPAQTSQYTNLFIEPNPYYSEYLDIEVGFGSACNWGTIADSTIFMSFYFNSPCSKVSILSPTNNWSIKKEKLKDEQIIFTLGDYDIKNKNLDSILMEYKKFGDNKWTQFWAISREDLATYYEAERFSGNPPTYPVVWKITNDRKIIDGNYDIRAVSKCDVGGYMYSNITSGKINRSALYVIGDPKPSDGVLSKGEEISVAFNEAINCYGVDSSSQYLSFTSAESGLRISTQVYCNQLNGLVFKISDADMAKFDGKLINAMLYNIVDINGNGLAGDTVKWSFVISNNPIFWATNNLEFNITAGSSDSIVTYLFNTGNISRQFSLNGMNGVLDAKPQYPSNLVTLAGMPILVKINAANLKPDSSYTYLLKATIPGFSDLNLPIKVNVYSNDVRWSVNRSLYSATSNIIANFKINGDTSKDSRDKIAVIIDNTVRGFANIRKIDGYWAAYITVYGSSADNGKPMEFRIWKASSGTEFDARAAVSYNYVINKVFGTLLDPIILDVNTATDTVRYIPLVPGWNSLSFNTVLPSDSINKVLGRLRNFKGSFVKTLNTSAAYNKTKWVSTINLDRLRADSGYMIYLTDYDTLLFSGAASTPKTIPLKEGWNMIGYSYATDKPINSVLRSASADGDIIKTSFGEGVSMFDGNNNRWVGSLDTLRRFKSYMMKVQSKDGGTAYKTNYVPFGKTKGLTAVRSAEYGNNMYIQGKILLNGFWSLHDGDQVFAYVGNECRGVGTLDYISDLGQSYVSMFVYANKDSEIVSFQILSLPDSTWYDCIDSFPFATNQILGSFSEPYVFKNMNSLMPYTDAKTIIPAEVAAYPNPTSKEVQLKLSNLSNQPVELSLTDMSGKKIWSATIKPDQATYNYMIDLDKLGLAKGIYMVGVNSHNLAKVIKLVKVN